MSPEDLQYLGQVQIQHPGMSHREGSCGVSPSLRHWLKKRFPFHFQMNKYFLGEKEVAAIFHFPVLRPPRCQGVTSEENSPNTQDFDTQSCTADVLL